MSFVEDNGLDIEPVDVSEDWYEGFHTDKNCHIWKLKDMEESHLENLISMFEGHDTTPLEEELKNRKEAIVLDPVQKEVELLEKVQGITK